MKEGYRLDKQDRRDKIAAYKARPITGGVFCIKNTITGRILLQAATDLHGCKNRFDFSQMTGSCIEHRLQQDWKQYGAQAFAFEILDTMEKKETQTSREFRDDIDALLESWREKLQENPQY